MDGTQEHPAHRPLYGARAGSVQRFLAGLKATRYRRPVAILKKALEAHDKRTSGRGSWATTKAGHQAYADLRQLWRGIYVQPKRRKAGALGAVKPTPGLRAKGFADSSAARCKA